MIVWISYNGGSVPIIPRRVTPIHWVIVDKIFACKLHDADHEYANFPIRKVLDIQNEKWDIKKQ